MIQLSRMTDYALLVLTHLARQPRGTKASARDLAEATDLPAPTVSKVLKTLTRAELLESHRGAHGGYQLAHDPEDVTVAEIIRLFEGPIALTMCSEGPGKCDLETNCTIRHPLKVVNDAIRGTLENLHLAAIAAPQRGVAVSFAAAAVESALTDSARRERVETSLHAAIEAANQTAHRERADVPLRLADANGNDDEPEPTNATQTADPTVRTGSR